MRRSPVAALTLLFLFACSGTGSGDGGTDGPDPDACANPPFETGDDGHADPLGAAAGEARAGRIDASELPVLASGLSVYEAGDFVLANDRVAILIEDVGDSDLYDPWGGRPVGFARVEGNALVEPADFGEVFLFAGFKHTVMTESVSVLNDGSNGQPAIVRAHGRLKPMPFITSLTGLLRGPENVPAAIDYVLAPDSNTVQVFFEFRPERSRVDDLTTLHGFMYTDRMRLYSPDFGFDGGDNAVDWVAYVDDDATSLRYLDPSSILGGFVSESGFVGKTGARVQISGCSPVRAPHAELTIGGPGLDELLVATAEEDGIALRTVEGVVRTATSAPVEGARVHAVIGGTDYVTRSAFTGVDGAYRVHVPEGADVDLVAYRGGEGLGTPATVTAGTADVAAFDLVAAPGGVVDVTVTNNAGGGAIPARIEAFRVSGSPRRAPASHGETPIPSGRIDTVYSVDGTAKIRVPPGDVRVVASHGYEYSLGEDDLINVLDGETRTSTLGLDHVVATPGVMCADFHLHTSRSNDAGDDVRHKLRAAAADGLEIPARSDHEWISEWDSVVQSLGLTDWLFGFTSLELTTFEIYGHFGVIPAAPAAGINGGTPLWQRWPTPSNPDQPVETILAPELFAAVRARPEQPAIIINHPRGGANYFTYVGYDPVLGTVQRPADWDDAFGLVEVFNNSDWQGNRNGTVRDWLSFLDHGRTVFAVGSSDSHGVVSSPVGYPRTCLTVGTDDPNDLRAPTGVALIREATSAGRSFVSGGLYLDVSVGSAGPGETATVGGTMAAVDVEVQGAPWIDFDEIVIVVDGQDWMTLPVTIADDPLPTTDALRFAETFDVPVAATGSYVIVVAQGDDPIPIDPGTARPFAVSNPIFLER